MFIKGYEYSMNKKKINIIFINIMKLNNCLLFKYCYKCYYILKFFNLDIVFNILNICYNCLFNEKLENV